MKIEILKAGDAHIAVVHSERVLITETQDALDLMSDAQYQGAEGMVIFEQNLDKSFFDLKSGLAGEILQKFSTYQVKLGIVGDFQNIKSKSLNDFIMESNRYKKICFVQSVEEALQLFNR